MGQLPIKNVIPDLSSQDQNEFTKTILGLRFKPVQTQNFIYLGTEKLLDNFIVPNLGFDY